MIALTALATLLLLAGVPQTPTQAARDSGRVPVVGSGVISGTVTADEPGEAPVRRAVVRINGSSHDDGGGHGMTVSRVAVTDDKGRYAITSLPAGRYYLSVEKGGWVMTSYGARRLNEGGMPIAVAEGQPVVVNVKLPRGAVIAGRVVDEHGQPQFGARPVLLEFRTINGQRRLVQVPILISFLAQTNDLGEYRLHSIPAGTYVVAVRPAFSVGMGSTIRATTEEEVAWARQATPALATTASAAPAPPPGQSILFAPVYHPGVTDASAAATITVAAGEQRVGVDFVMTLSPTAMVRGVVMRPDGQPAAGARVGLSRTRGALSPIDTTSAQVTADAKGVFTFGAVASGEFTISARASSQSAAPAPADPRGGARPAPPVLDLWGTSEVTVGGRDVSGITLALQPGMNVTGRVIFEGTGNTPVPPAANIRITVASVTIVETAQTGMMGPGANMSMGSANADGTFAFEGLAPGRYILMASGTGTAIAWMQKAAMAGGRNVFEGGLEIRAGENIADVALVFTDQLSEISGRLLDAADRPAPEYSVFVFPTDKAAWTQLSPRMRPPARPGSDGRYALPRLLPGEYYVAALSSFDPSSIYDTAFLEQVAASAIKITIADGEKKILDLRIGIK